MSKNDEFGFILKGLYGLRIFYMSGVNGFLISQNTWSGIVSKILSEALLDKLS